MRILITLCICVALNFGFVLNSYAQDEADSVSVQVQDGKVVIKTADGRTKVIDLDDLESADSKANRLIVKQSKKSGDQSQNSFIKAEDVFRFVHGNGDAELFVLDPASQEGQGIYELRQADGENSFMFVNPDSSVAQGKYMIGVHCEPLPDALRAHLGIDEKSGLLINDVIEDSPAADLLKDFDIILKANGKAINSIEGLVKAVQKAGDDEEAVELDLLRAGEKFDASITPVERKQNSVRLPEPGKLLPRVRLSPKMENRFDLAIPGEGMVIPRVTRLPGASNADDLAKQIEELRKQVEELSKAIKDKD